MWDLLASRNRTQSVLFLVLLAFLQRALVDCFTLVSPAFHHGMLERLVPLVIGQAVLKKERRVSEIYCCLAERSSAVDVGANQKGCWVK